MKFAPLPLAAWPDPGVSGRARLQAALEDESDQESRADFVDGAARSSTVAFSEPQRHQDCGGDSSEGVDEFTCDSNS
jgi:hypothetical protein